MFQSSVVGFCICSFFSYIYRHAQDASDLQHSLKSHLFRLIIHLHLTLAINPRLFLRHVLITRMYRYSVMSERVCDSEVDCLDMSIHPVRCLGSSNPAEQFCIRIPLLQRPRLPSIGGMALISRVARHQSCNAEPRKLS